MYRLILSCMFLFLSVSPVYSQGFLLDKGQSAWFLGAAYQNNDAANSFGGGIGYTVRGFMDISFDVYNEKYKDIEMRSLDLDPSVIFYPIRQSKVIPFTVAVGGLFDKFKCSGDYLDEYDFDMDGYSYGLVAGLSTKIDLVNNMFLVPAASMTFTNMKTTADGDGFTLATKNHFRETAISLAFGFGSMTVQGYIRPGLSFDKEGDDTRWVQTGVIFLK